MQKKVTVAICTGTACFVMGGSDILTLEDHLPDTLKNKIEISGTSCMDYCKDASKGKSPFVEIDGKLMSEASVPKIIDYLLKLVNES